MRQLVRNGRLSSLAVLAICLVTVGVNAARGQDSVITYQGQLKSNGEPVDGSANFEFHLFDQQTGGNEVGAPIIQSLLVQDGLFTVPLDFGIFPYTLSEPLWLEIQVNSETLPRQPLTPTPYSLATRGMTVSSDNLERFFATNAFGNGLSIVSDDGFPGIWGMSNFIGEQDIIRMRRDVELWPDTDAEQSGSLTLKDTASFTRMKLVNKAGFLPTFERIVLNSEPNEPSFFNAGNVGIGTTDPDYKLEVFGGKLGLSNSATNDNEMVLINGSTYAHPDNTQTFGDGGSPFIMASSEGTAESSGIYGDGDALALWSPGDGAPGQPAAICYFLDEDRWTDDSDPYNGTAVVAYLNDSGVWVASDINRKQAIEPLAADDTSATDKVMQLGTYTYEYRHSSAKPHQVGIAAEPPRRAVGLIAQELIKVLPEAVEVSDSGEHFVNMNCVTPLLLEALKEQVARNNELEARIARLEQLLEP